ncbi:MAG: PhzF family phenazine biosynthesis protein [Kiloniellales bacterium]|nr:PhzF family phenazine biosynthesis protein [Kiloniellales bacterium]
MTLPIYVVDAFAEARFAGNPAAVCPLETWLPDEVMQAIAAENNLSETAFLVKADGAYDLRWFTPAKEVDLCGHATLGSAFVISTYLDPEARRMVFRTRSGELVVTRDGERLTMDFPALAPQPVERAAEVTEALGFAPQAVLAADKLMAVLESEAEVLAAAPNLDLVAVWPEDGLIITAPGETCDFVSRFFAPAGGIPEDPVTGSAHCVLAPYWAERLGKTELSARQVSARGGALDLSLAGDRVMISGRVVPYLEGIIHV